MSKAALSGTDEQVWRRWVRPGPTPVQQRNDVWLALAVVAGAMVMTVLVNSMGVFLTEGSPSVAERFAWGVAVTVPLVVRRRYPLVVLIVIGLLFILSQAREIGDNFVPSIALFLAIYNVGAWGRNRTVARWARIGVIVVMFGYLAFVIVRSLVRPHEFEGAAGPLDPVLAAVLYQVGINLLYFFAAYFFGNLAWLSARRQAELVHRAEQLRLSQEQNMRGAVMAERVRIARDLHDVVAHHVSVMGVQAGAARRVLDSDPDLARSALHTVEQVARTAIGDLRGLLGVLREGDEVPDQMHPSSPGLDQLAELVSTARAAGLEVDHGVYGEPRPVPDGVALSAFRVVQEALTNIIKHSGAHRADVRVRYLDQTLEVEITDDGQAWAAHRQPPGGGLGLMGMRERVAVHGGELEAGPRRDAGYRVRVSLPTTARSAS